MTKSCNACGVVKPYTEFHKHTNGGTVGGVANTCKLCRNAQRMAQRAQDPTSTKSIRERSRVWRLYGIREADLVAMREAQGGVCKLCGEPNKTKRGSLHIDHCHTTGKVRGLLCHNCNLMLGHARDNVDVLKAAIDYLNAAGGVN